MNHQELKAVKIPDSITEIGTEAFMNCFELENVYLGISLEKVGDRAFLYTDINDLLYQNL